MTIRYLEKIPDAEEYLELFETTGWNMMYGADASELAAALRSSWYLISAYRDDTLVGVGRLVSDGVLYAVVFDMIVSPECKSQGIGKEILRRLLLRCEQAGIRDILLFSAKGTKEFYCKYGFQARPGDAPGMILRKVKSE